MQEKWVELIGGERLHLKVSSIITGSLSVYLEESGRGRKKMAEILPDGKFGGKEYEEYLAPLKAKGAVTIPADAVFGVASFDVSGHRVEVRHRILDKKEIKNPLKRMLTVTGVAPTTEITVHLNGNEILNWQ